MKQRLGIAFFLCFGLAALAMGQKTEARYVEVRGHKLWMESAGAGGPTVVLESGFGDSHDPWRKIFPQISKITRVVAYDRAGYGKSQPAATPESLSQIAIDLRAMLLKANVPPPYVLVGHSFGGAIIRAFAHNYSAQVCGLVWIDPISEGMLKFFPPEIIKHFLEQQEASVANAPQGAKGEWQLMKRQTLEGFKEQKSFGNPPDVPMVLLLAGSNRPPGWQESVVSVYQPWIFGASEGGMTYISRSSHYIQLDEPDAVLLAIRRVIFPNPVPRVRRSIREKGLKAGLRAYRQLRKLYPSEFVRESDLNTLGYEQLRENHSDSAVAIFLLNVEFYPESGIAYDSLGEAYAAAGKWGLARECYQKSLRLDPKNANAVRMIKKLESHR